MAVARLPRFDSGEDDEQRGLVTALDIVRPMPEHPDGRGSYLVEVHPVGGGDDWQLAGTFTRRQQAYDAARDSLSAEVDQARVINADGATIGYWGSVPLRPAEQQPTPD